MIENWNASDYQWFPAYASDWLLSKSVRLMTMEQRGLYWELLCMSWRDQGIPASLEDIAALTGTSLDFIEAAWARVGKMFEPSEDPETLVNPRQEEIRAEQAAKFKRRSDAGRTAGRASAAKRIVNESLTIGESIVNQGEGEGEGEEKESKNNKNIQALGDKSPRFDPLRAIWEGLPETHRTREVGAALKEYLTVRRENRWVAWKERYCAGLVKQWATMTPANVAAMLNFSASKNYQGLMPEKFTGKPKLAVVSGGMEDGKTSTMTEEKRANVARG